MLKSNMDFGIVSRGILIYTNKQRKTRTYLKIYLFRGCLNFLLNTVGRLTQIDLKNTIIVTKSVGIKLEGLF